MRIDLNARTPDIPEEKGTTRSGTRGQRVVPDSYPRIEDHASISLQSKVPSLVAQAQQAPEIREARVSALARAIGNGSYSVSAEQIADSMFSDMQARASRVR